MALKTAIAEVTTASTKKQWFTSSTLATWAAVGPHTSNTGIIFIGDGVVTAQYVVRTGDAGFPIIPQAGKAYVELSNLYLNSLAVSNQGVLLYIEK